MWEHYRRNAPVVQSFIIICCALAYWLKKPPQLILFAFVAMEIGAVCGAFWMNRLVKKMQEEHRKASKK